MTTYRVPVGVYGVGAAAATGGRWPAPAGSVGTLARRAVDLVVLWHGRARQRRQLRELPPHLLRDIGVDRPAALREADKPFWRP
jgi:uncharacterized protein YjiS (DUF1127 family)